MNHCLNEGDVVKFKVIMMSNAAMKEISLTTPSTKLSELKAMLSHDKYFGSKAPVMRQRIFHLGRELKSGGRSLHNLGLGRFNNHIIHLYVRPVADESKDTNTRDKVNISRKGSSTAVGTRKRNRETSPSTRRFCQRVERNVVNEGRTDGNNITISSRDRPEALSIHNSRDNNLAINLVDSSDDDDVEVVEVL
mmetsp:Transcript_22440/g.53341  ORF Transcript_22440/g.53341 Transcript_22440/m.53341 type:complete len:193 (+) Transcript_22440:146-724(+)